MAQYRLLKGHPFGDRSANVVGSQIIQQVVLKEHGHECEAANDVADERQNGVVDDVQPLFGGRQHVVVKTHKAAHGKPIQAD